MISYYEKWWNQIQIANSVNCWITKRDFIFFSPFIIVFGASGVLGTQCFRGKWVTLLYITNSKPIHRNALIAAGIFFAMSPVVVWIHFPINDHILRLIEIWPQISWPHMHSFASHCFNLMHLKCYCIHLHFQLLTIPFNGYNGINCVNVNR